MSSFDFTVRSTVQAGQSIHFRPTKHGTVRISIHSGQPGKPGFESLNIELTAQDLVAFRGLLKGFMNVVDETGALVTARRTALLADDAPLNECPPDLRLAIFARDGQVCQYCGDSQAPGYEIDHVVPVSRGGHTQPYNLVVACASCNNRKRARTWTPGNLDAITQDRPAWRELVLATAAPSPGAPEERILAASETLLARLRAGQPTSARVMCRPGIMSKVEWALASKRLQAQGLVTTRNGYGLTLCEAQP